MQKLLVLQLETLNLQKLVFQLTTLVIQLQENPDFGQQHLAFNRLGQIVHRTYFVAPEKLALVTIGRHKNNRNRLCFLVAPHELGHFKPIHAWHLHIQQHQGNFVTQ